MRALHMFFHVVTVPFHVVTLPLRALSFSSICHRTISPVQTFGFHWSVHRVLALVFSTTEVISHRLPERCLGFVIGVSAALVCRRFLRTKLTVRTQLWFILSCRIQQRVDGMHL